MYDRAESVAIKQQKKIGSRFEWGLRPIAVEGNFFVMNNRLQQETLYESNANWRAIYSELFNRFGPKLKFRQKHNLYGIVWHCFGA